MWLSRLALFIFGFLVACETTAAPLSPGALLYPVPYEITGSPLTGDALAFLTSPFTTATYSGSLTTLVVQGEDGNPFAGGLTFRYTFRNDPGSQHNINRLSINGFDGFLLDVFSETFGAVIGGAPAYVDRETNGSSIGFSFAALPQSQGPLVPGQVSHTLVVHTNATLFTGLQSSAFVLDGVPAGVAVYAPIPEPSAIALAATGLWLSLYFFRQGRRLR